MVFDIPLIEVQSSVILAVGYEQISETLRVIFNPFHSQLDESSIYPWDRMDKLNHEFKENGWRVGLEYNHPSITREAFEKEMRRVKGENVQEREKQTNSSGWSDVNDYDVLPDPASSTSGADREYANRFLQTL